MPKFTATRWYSTRAGLRHDFEADTEELAWSRVDRLEWREGRGITSEEFEDIDADATIELQYDGGDYLAENGPVPKARPYSWDARDFVHKVAGLAKEGAYSDAIETLDSLIREAAAICGQEI